MKTKQCTKCNEIKPVNEFHRDQSTSSGYRSQCKNCLKSSRCIDCGTNVCKGARRCRSCEIENRWTNGMYDGAQQSDEYRHMRSEMALIMWQDPRYREKHQAAMKKAMDNPAYKEKISQALKRAWNDPQYRQTQIEARKTAWRRGAYEGRETEEFKLKCSMAAITRWQDPDYRQNQEATRSNPEYKKRVNDAIKTAYQNPELRQRLSENTKTAWERGAFDGVFKSPTSIELKVSAALDILGIEHQPQYRPRGYSRIFDEFVLPNILIEAQGDYWHSLEKKQKADVEKAAWAKENGYDLVTIWEHEINKYGAWAIVLERIWPLLQE